MGGIGGRIDAADRLASAEIVVKVAGRGPVRDENSPERLSNMSGDVSSSKSSFSPPLLSVRRQERRFPRRLSFFLGGDLGLLLELIPPLFVV
jgi:hypothetical protein